MIKTDEIIKIIGASFLYHIIPLTLDQQYYIIVSAVDGLDK